MASVSKFVLSITMLLTILVTLQFKGGKSNVFHKDKVTVYIVNNITNLQLGVHCKDKNTDIGFQKLNFNQSYVFTFRPKVIFESTLYFCRFTWPNEFHYFDIYIETRDEEMCNSECHWEINKSGPCRVNGYIVDCFPWNKNVFPKGRQLGEESVSLNV
ncbi:hypothetical protein QL285_057197 [Trifolium repens]|nr:hypothetical protein QL285_057197 [Trifolium repens]